MTTLQALGLVFLPVGIIMLALAVYFFSRKKRFLANSVIIEGRVTGFREVDSTVFVSSADDDATFRHEENMHRSTSMAPEITFRDSLGVERTILGPGGTATERMQIGDRMPVRYSRDNPDQATTTDFLSTWLEVLALSLIGGVFVLIGAVFLLV